MKSNLNGLTDIKYDQENRLADRRIERKPEVL